ncbi:hypothetical protein AOQ84DRAFT_399341 [Glonium stellatum]|uniref:DUF6604 domain-containing protein n=1 Tax=Glonium stellatum TaxID=574774 RepID=A0A8E2JQY7_9PEZI|nr:hypothetical protein AOQ84DRAFT_399341 [Glonium stellatum]
MIVVKDFISLAQCIASYKSVVDVSAEFAATLDRAIAVRKEHTTLHSAFSDEERAKEGSNEGHMHFIGVLEEVRTILKPRMSAKSLERSAALYARSESPTPELCSSFGNSFENLSIEEPSNNFLASFDPGTKQGTTVKQPEYEVEHIHDLAAEFIKAFPEYADAEKIIKIFYVAQCLTHGEDPMYKERPDDGLNFKMYDVGSLAFLPTLVLLSSFASVLEVNSTPIMKPGFYGHYNASSDRKAKSSREKFLEDKIILLEALPDFCLIARANNTSIPGEDELTRGLRKFFKDKTISLWLVFAAQTFLDINHSLREGTERAFAELQRTGKNIEASLNENFRFHENLKVETWPKSNDMVLQDILDRINVFVKVDPITKAKQLLRVREGVSSEPFFLYRRHPLLCGLMTFALKALFKEAGIAFANAWGSILYASHIYNTARQEKFLEGQWIGMEMAIGLHGAEKFYVGDHPKAIKEYFKRFYLSMGYSAANFAKNKRKGLPIVSKAGPRGLEDLSPISQIFKERLCHPSYKTTRLDLTLEDAQKILDNAVVNNDASINEAESDRAKKGLPELPIEGFPKERTRLNRKLHKQWERYHSCTLTQLLYSLRDAIQPEVFELTFDHFRLHRMCWRLLRMIKENLDEELKKLYGPGYLETESQLPFVVGYIFMAATNTKTLAGLLHPKKNDEVTSKLLMKAAETVQGMLDSGVGDFCLKLMRESWGMGIEIEFD